MNFAAGGVATPADAALMMQLGLDGVFVGSGIFKSGNPASRAHAIVQAVTHFNDPQILAEVSTDTGRAYGRHQSGYAERSGEDGAPRMVEKPGSEPTAGAACVLTIGVLALQGAFAEHIAMLKRVGVQGVEVRKPEQLDGVQGLIVPGGESTTMGLIARTVGTCGPAADVGARRTTDMGNMRWSDPVGRPRRGAEARRAAADRRPGRDGEP